MEKLLEVKVKNIIVTGAAKGLGFAIVKKLLAEGYKVITVIRKPTQELLNLLEQYEAQLALYEFDLVNVEKIKDLVKEITKTHGRIYGLVNNAAVGHDGVLATMHERQITELLKVNVESPIVLTKYVSRSMLLQQEGRILNVGSIIGKTGFNGLAVYGASKAALEGFTRSLSRELGRANITVNTLAPGYMETNMTSGLTGSKLESIVRRSPLGKLASTEDAAELAAFLISDKAKMITGGTYVIDAGSTA